MYKSSQKTILFLIGIFSVQLIFAQDARKALQEMVQAEQSFAAYARENSTKTAFLEFLADSGLIVTNRPILGKSFWNNIPENKESLLAWRPHFAEISASLDFGYTTGTYEVFLKRDSLPVGFGYFNSVWSKQEDGNWKVLIDVGNRFSKPEQNTPSWKEVLPNRFRKSNPRVSKIILNLEKNFNNTVKHIGIVNTFHKYFSTRIRFYRNDIYPILDKSSAISYITKNESKFTLTPLGCKSSSAGDMAFSYGTYSCQRHDQKTQGSYLHIWKKERTGWQIVLEVM